MPQQTIAIPVADETTVTGVFDRPEDCRPGVTPGLVLGHGSSNDMNHPLLAALGSGLASLGAATVLRFNFPFAERGSRSPDSQARLEMTLRQAHDALARDTVCPPGPVYLGGKSLGARMAAELVSRYHEGEGLLPAGLILLTYPLHKPGRKDRLALEHLRRINVPSLFVVGSEDPFCDLALLPPVLDRLEPPGRAFLVEGGDHSLRVREAGRQTDIYKAVTDAVAAFILETSRSDCRRR